MTNRYDQFLAENGISLDKLGIQEVALRREDALMAIQLLRESLIPLLGGDVYFSYGGVIEPAYANWYVERQASELPNDFVERSFLRAEGYILSFQEIKNRQPLFVLVPLTD